MAGRAEAVMGEMGIVKDAESTEQSGDKRELKGKKGDLDVTIQIKRECPRPRRSRYRPEESGSGTRSTPRRC